METPALPVCPECKQTDQIQKVTSIYGLNTKEWYESRSTTDSDGSTRTYQERHEAHTTLGLKLEPPQKPDSPGHPGLWYGIGGFIALILLSTLCPVVLIPVFFVIPMFAAAPPIQSISDIPFWMVIIVVIGLVLVVVGVAVIVWLGLLIKRRFDRDMNNYRDKKAIYDRDDLPRWQRARDRWDQLYYCMRDETVFIPTENKAIKVDDMEKYLYDPYFKG
jgi:hypothetical protein